MGELGGAAHVVGSAVERAALAELFWDSLEPATRALLEELAEAKTWDELAERWGYADPKGVRRFVRHQLRRRLEREGAIKWLSLLVAIPDA